MKTINDVIPLYEGGQSGIARLLGITPQAVHQWVVGKRPVPPRHCIAIEAATGLSRHELRPDIFGPPPVPDGAPSAPPSPDVHPGINLHL